MDVIVILVTPCNTYACLLQLAFYMYYLHLQVCVLLTITMFFCFVLCNNWCVKTARSKTEEPVTNNRHERTKSLHLHISFNNVLNHKCCI